MNFKTAEVSENQRKDEEKLHSSFNFIKNKTIRSPDSQISSQKIKKFNIPLKKTPKEMSPFTILSDDSTRNSSIINSSSTAFSLEKFENTIPNKSVTCSCKNSQCLKLYCECFSAGGYCDPELCSCKGCSNNIQNEVKKQIKLLY